jgi:hypothetical protein
MMPMQMPMPKGIPMIVMCRGKHGGRRRRLCLKTRLKTNVCIKEIYSANGEQQLNKMVKYTFKTTTRTSFDRRELLRRASGVAVAGSLMKGRAMRAQATRMVPSELSKVVGLLPLSDNWEAEREE